MTSDSPNKHDAIHTALDHIDEIAEMLSDDAIVGDGDFVTVLTKKRLFFLSDVLKEASRSARAASRRLPDSPYAIEGSEEVDRIADCLQRGDVKGALSLVRAGAPQGARQ